MKKLCALAVCFASVQSASAVTLREGEKIIADSLKDPASVQFRGVKAYKSGAVCGEYNAKNGFGGYVGFARFGVSADGSIMDAPDVSGLDADYAKQVLALFEAKCESGF